jgi:hypothetical protein
MKILFSHLIFRVVNAKRIIKNKMFSKYLIISTKDLFSLQYDINGEYQNMDGVVRYLAIKNYYGKNNIGFNLYEKMQKNRISENWNARFKELIASFEKNGFLPEFPIVVGSNYMIMNGSHRLALAVYHKINYVPIKVMPQFKDRRYSIQWFQENDFSKKELQIIKEAKSKLVKSMTYNFSAIIWPPAVNHSNLIIEILNTQRDVKVISHKKYELDDFDNFLRLAYASDDITLEKINKKIDYIYNSTNSDTKRLIHLDIHISDREYRVKTSGQPQLLKTMELKKIVRQHVRPLIKNYEHDIILHISDNYFQTQSINNLLSLNRNLSQLFELLAQINYVAYGIDSLNHPDNFPNSFFFKTDIDLIMPINEMCRAKLLIRDFLFKKYNLESFNVNEIVLNNEIKIRLEHTNQLIFQFHLQFPNKLFYDEFLNKVLQEKIIGLVNIPEMKHELILRWGKYINNQKKSHHLHYIQRNLNSLDTNYLNNSLKFNKKLISTSNKILTAITSEKYYD